MKNMFKYLMMTAKYVFALLFPLGAVIFHAMSWEYLLVAVVELLAIIVFTNTVHNWNKAVGYILNVALLAVMNAQFAILFWANSFTSMVMINNLGSLEALSGKGTEYGITFAVVVLFTLLPVASIRFDKKKHALAAIVVCLLCALVYLTGSLVYSPYYGVYDVLKQRSIQKKAEVLAQTGDNEKIDFYKASVSDYISKPDALSEQPNVILIFTEGLSQNLIEDERNVMPNVRALQDDAISFENYFNHTFATYMGLSGQLYSGYQKEIYDPNLLVSLQGIFKDHGYQTTFINTEPKNKEFTEYLSSFQFDELLNDTTRLDGINSSISDKSAYELLFETAVEQHKEEEPFLISMYTFGTHVSFDSVHEKFEDGSDPLLNRFYDVDAQFGLFLEAFKNSDLAEDTVLIFTTDHATYQDSSFIATYPEYYRASTMLDRVPFIIYYQGVEPKKYDVEGRNSLDLTPTILDFLDMTGENYFLGESLFSPTDNNSPYDTYFESMSAYNNTESGEITSLSLEQLLEVQVQVEQYFALKLNLDQNSQITKEVTVYAGVSTDGKEIEVEILNAQGYEHMRLGIWSESGEQDDLQWFDVEQNQENVLTMTVDLANYSDTGTYQVHLYDFSGEEAVFLAATKLTVNP